VTAGVSVSGVFSTAMPQTNAKSPAEAEVVLHALRRTRQIRDFRPDPVPDEVLEQILDVARWSGSAKNRQPWTFIVIRQHERLAHLAELAPNASHLAKAPAAIAIVMPGESVEQDIYDEARAAERILIAANALGLGAGIGWAIPSKRDAVGEYLDVTPPAFVRTFVSIGYPSDAAMAPKSAPGTARKPLADLVRYERFG
jgi:nitroreductase